MSELKKAISRNKYIRDNFDLDDHDKGVMSLVIEAAEKWLECIGIASNATKEAKLLTKKFNAEETKITKSILKDMDSIGRFKNKGGKE